MTVEDKIKKLVYDVREACVEVAKDAHAYIGTHELVSNPFIMDKYPTMCIDYFYNDECFSEGERDEIPFLKYRIPKYEMRSFPEGRKYYTAIFEGYKKDYINLKDYKKIDEIKSWIDSEPEILKRFTKDKSLPDYVIRGMVRDIVERYLYITNADKDVPDSIGEEIEPFVIEKIKYYIDEVLYFDICVPVCLATFEKKVKLDDYVEIIRIPDELQKARQAECKYEVAREDWLSSCATHMIVLHNYYMKREDVLEYGFNQIMQDYAIYPIKRIDEVVGLIRVATSYDIGYEQVLCVPKGWVYETTADLAVVYGAKAHFVNPKYMKKIWMQLPVSCVTSEQCDRIKELYDGYILNEERLQFSLMRLNRCVLRDKVDDMTTDACIGLESLLAGGVHTEITNTIAGRMPVILSKTKSITYPSKSGRKLMKKVYNLRSRIVHGEKPKDKDVYTTLDERKIYVPQMAVDFLHITLEFMISNPEYLRVEAFDDYLDSLVENIQ